MIWRWWRIITNLHLCFVWCHQGGAWRASPGYLTWRHVCLQQICWIRHIFVFHMLGSWQWTRTHVSPEELQAVLSSRQPTEKPRALPGARTEPGPRPRQRAGARAREGERQSERLAPGQTGGLALSGAFPQPHRCFNTCIVPETQLDFHIWLVKWQIVSTNVFV